MARHNPKLYNRMMELLPDSTVRLVSSGAVAMKLNKGAPPGAPTAYAWTEWSKRNKHFVINFTDAVNELDDDALIFLWYHEFAHIVLNHFSPAAMECQRMDRLLAADIAVNYQLRQSKDIIDQLEAIDAEEWLEKIGLGQQTYPYFVIHDLVHEQVDEHAENCPGCGGEGGSEGHEEGDNPCGGIEETTDPRAVARAISVSKAMEADDSPVKGMGIGSIAGSMGISLPESDLPDWLPAVERFARSVVEVELVDARTHKRAQPTLRSAGIRVPSLRPTYKSVPSTLCLLVDTSGSMLGDLHYVAPVLSYLKQNGITTRLIAGDTRVTFDEIIDRIPEELTGAGGTDIVPLLDRSKDYDPKALVFFTDGYVPSWGEDPGIPVLFVGCHTDTPYGEKA